MRQDWLVRHRRIQNLGNTVPLVGLVPTLADSRHPVTAQKPRTDACCQDETLYGIFPVAARATRGRDRGRLVEPA